MALFDLETNRAVTEVPYRADYDLFRQRMTPQELAAVAGWISNRIEGNEIHTAGWMPGDDWTGTPLEAIFLSAARRDRGAAARCFGLLVYVEFMRHPDEWISGRFELNGREIGSRTYFRRRL